MKFHAEISAGELLDRISILRLKLSKVPLNQRDTIERELTPLEEQRELMPNRERVEALAMQLDEINRELWQVEDDLRLHEAGNLFDERFLQLARAVYLKNDLRAALKQKINLTLTCAPGEWKSYPLPEC